MVGNYVLMHSYAGIILSHPSGRHGELISDHKIYLPGTLGTGGSELEGNYQEE